ncbi:MAG: class A beta-lactamase-related serine hydrolase [Gemmatimonadota bacterium]|nr:class A beta-lactamase-related serine hydrolase [Gemmatimonadota bacterium]
MTYIETAISRIEATVGVSARHLETGREIQHNADDVFFTASTLKVPVLVELYRQVDRGIVDLDRRVELTDELRVPESGILKEMTAGINPSLHDLAMLMIIISDNTATDILYDLVGGDNLNNTTRDLGLHKTRIPMTVRQLLFSVVGLDPENAGDTYDLCAERLFNEAYVRDAAGYDPERSDVSSPGDMCRLLELLYSGEILSPASTEGALDILKRQQLRTVIPYALPVGTTVAHKTGFYLGVRADAGIVYSPTGPYTIAIMAKHVTSRDRMAFDLSLAALSRVVYDALVE